MNHRLSFATCADAVRRFIARSDDPMSAEREREFNALALAVFVLQFEQNPILRRLCARRGVTLDDVDDWRALPAWPTAAFREFELTTIDRAARAAEFHSSGTSGTQSSRHFHSAESLALYQASARPWFARHLLTVEEAAARTPEFLSLTPPPERVPHSSLVHMIATVAQSYARGPGIFLGTTEGATGWTVNAAAAVTAFDEARRDQRPVVLMGTAFNFVHLLDDAPTEALRLPPGSRIMETGGYKGRSRELPKAELHAAMQTRFGVPAERIITEYGMCELSSQAYDQTFSEPCHERLFHFPPWARPLVISPETQREVADGEVGVLRVIDLANVWSAVAVQTQDLARRRGGGFELIGRAPAAEARGCSLMAVPAEAAPA